MKKLLRQTHIKRARYSITKTMVFVKEMPAYFVSFDVFGGGALCRPDGRHTPRGLRYCIRANKKTNLCLS